MQLKYLLLILLIPVSGIKAAAQINKPVVEDAAPGSFAYPVSGQNAVTTQSTINTPPEVVTGGDANSVTTYVPITPIEDEGVLVPGCSPANVKQLITYTDGNNVPFQSTNRYVAMINGQGKHLVQIADSRVQRSQFNFLPFSSANEGLLSNAFQQQKAYYDNLYPDEGYTSFSQSLNSSNTTSRSSTSYAPGKSQVGQGHGTISTAITNANNEVRIWEIGNNNLPEATGYYAANELSGMETILPNGSTGANNNTSTRTKAYSDKDGKLILKMVADGYSNNTVTYQYTYYVYDVMGNLIYTITPKAYAFFEGNNASFQGYGDIVDNLCFKNVYDNKGRLIAAHKPNEQGLTYIVYDRKSRPVMRQTPKEAGTPEWEVTFYDPYGRVKATSVFSSSNNQAAMQTQLDNWTGGGTTNLMYYLATDEGEKVIPAENAIAGNTIMSYTVYDNYDLADPAGTALGSFATYGLQSNEYYNTSGAEIPVISMRVQGMPTGSKVRILPPAGSMPINQIGNWRTSVNFYDDKGHVIYAINQDLYTDHNITTPIHQHYNSTQYDFAGRAIIGKHVMVNANSQDAVATHTEFTKNQFESATGNLLKTWHKVDNDVWAVLNAFTYDDMGRVKRKSLGNGGEVQDYTYNIRGQLAGINGVYAETGNKEGVSKTFGEALKYDFGFTDNRYDGKLAGVVWRGSGVNERYAYGYGYKQNGFLAKADFTHNNMMLTDWENYDMDYSVSNLEYDKNGNILYMNQKGMDPSNPGQPKDIDILEYSYDGWSNQLASVDDQGEDIDGNGDFRKTPASNVNGNTGYTYDANGNLITDANKDAAITYNWFNKPALINFTNSNSIEYAYDAAGNKMAEYVTDNTNSTAKLTEYMGNFVYVDNKLSYILTSEGRTVFDDQSAMPVREEFFVKDHLGNVRSTINVSTYDVRTYLATYELASANLENLVFANLDEIRDYKPGGDQGDYMAANLDGADDKSRVGSSLLVHVMAGDKVSMNVNNYYQSYNQYDDSPVNEGDVLASLTGALMGGAGGFQGSESHNTQLVNELFNDNNFSAFNEIVNSQHTDPTKPRAYLNYILFNEKMQVVREMTGAFQANGDGNWTEIGTTAALEVPENGYLAVYLSNASIRYSLQEGLNVFFDRLRFTVTKGNLLEESHYYPFGLPIKTLGSSTDEFREQRRRYQGNEYITDIGLNWMDFNNRSYDPQIGRFLQIDPLAAFGGQDMMSPYAAMGNMPEMMVDPLGLMAGFDKDNPSGINSNEGGGFSNLQRPDYMSLGGGHMYTMSGIDLDPNNLFDPQGAFNALVIQVQHDLAQQQMYNTFNSALSDAGIGNRIVDGKWTSAGGGTNDNAINSSMFYDNDYWAMGVELVFAKKKGFFGKLWGGVKNAYNSVKNFVSSYEISGEIVYSVGAQVGVEVSSPLGGIGVEANILSVELGTTKKKNILNLAEVSETSVVGDKHWMNLRQGASIDFIVGGASIERTMLSPVEGGAFYDKKVTTETKVFGYNHKSEYYQPGLSTPYRPAPEVSTGIKFGVGFKFIFGAQIDFNIHKKN